MENRVEHEAEAFWRYQQEALSRNPSIAQSRSFWSGQAKLLDSLIKKFDKDPNLNVYEIASLTTMQAMHKRIDQLGSRQILQKTGRLAGNTATATLRMSADILDNRLNSTLGKIADQSPFLIKLPLQLLRLPIAAAALALKLGADVLNGLTQLVLPAPNRNPADTYKQHQQHRQFTAPQNVRDRIANWIAPDRTHKRGQASGQSSGQQQSNNTKQTGQQQSKAADSPAKSATDTQTDTKETSASSQQLPEMRLPGLSSGPDQNNTQQQALRHNTDQSQSVSWSNNLPYSAASRTPVEHRPRVIAEPTETQRSLKR